MDGKLKSPITATVSALVRPVLTLVLASLAAVPAGLSCSSGTPSIAEDENPTEVSASQLTFEAARPLLAGELIRPDGSLVVVFTPATNLVRGSLIAIAFPTAVQEEAGDLWSIPVTDAGASGFCGVDERSAGMVEIAFAGRAKGGAGRIVLRAKRQLAAGENVRFRMSGQVPRIVPRQPFRVIELDSRTGVAARLSDANVSLPPVIANSAERVLATLPSDAGAGERISLKLAALDAFGNVDIGFRGSVTLSGPLEGLPGTVSFTDVDRGLKSVDGVSGAKPGIVRVVVGVTVDTGLWTTESNPMRLWDGVPKMRRFIGDAHFHSGSDVASLSTDGGDHRGQFVSSADAYAFLRDVSAADWGVSAEHDTGMSDATWIANQQRVASTEQDGEFVTLIGYEWTPPRRLGHHVVVFEGPPGPENPLIGASSGRRGGVGASNVAELAATLRAASSAGRRVLLIPHVMQPFPNGDTDREGFDSPHEIWDGPVGSPSGAYVFNDLRRVGEMYSHHNDDFSVDGFRQTRDGRGDAVNQPQLFELGVNNSWSYQHAWATGHRIGVIGGSDNHFGTPGLNDYVKTVPHHAGLTIVIAPGLTHRAIFDGLYERRCYATTGARILVDFTVDGLEMGSEAVRPAGSRLPIRVSVAGTARVDSVEVLKFVAGEFVVTSGQFVRSSDKDVTLNLVDTLDSSTLYYLRIRQSDGEWAWTSPIWIDVVPS